MFILASVSSWSFQTVGDNGDNGGFQFIWPELPGSLLLSLSCCLSWTGSDWGCFLQVYSKRKENAVCCWVDSLDSLDSEQAPNSAMSRSLLLEHNSLLVFLFMNYQIVSNNTHFFTVRLKPYTHAPDELSNLWSKALLVRPHLNYLSQPFVSTNYQNCKESNNQQLNNYTWEMLRLFSKPPPCRS